MRNRKLTAPSPKSPKSPATPKVNRVNSWAPKSPMSATVLREGIQVLEDFGFRTQNTAATAPRLSVLLESPKPAKALLYVTDFWSQRQQKEFLVKSGLRRAQYAREQRDRREAFFAAKEKIEGVHASDQLYERLVADDDPVGAGKLYAAGPQGRLMKQLRNQLACNSPRLSLKRRESEGIIKPFTSSGRLGKLHELLTRCEDTIKRNTESRQ